MAGASARSRRGEPEGSAAGWRSSPMRSLSLGFLAMLPLIAVYEVALATAANAPRNAAELLMGASLEPLGEAGRTVRWSILGLAGAAALWTVLRRRVELGSALARTMREGNAYALASGPGMDGLLALLGDAAPELEASWAPPEASPSLARAALLMGGGAYEELLFRVGLYGTLFLVARALARWARLGERGARVLGEGVGLLGSSALFAAAHLRAVVSLLGEGGEVFDPGLFLWRFLAGVLLALLFRLRGPGVAAWTHAVFNVGLEIGVGPDVLT